MIDQTVVVAAFIVSLIALVALLSVCIAVGSMAAFIEQRWQIEWRVRRRKKKVIDILSPSTASRRWLDPQVSEVLRNGQQEADDELRAAIKDIFNMAADKESDNEKQS